MALRIVSAVWIRTTSNSRPRLGLKYRCVYPVWLRVYQMFHIPFTYSLFSRLVQRDELVRERAIRGSDGVSYHRRVIFRNLSSPIVSVAM